MVTTVGRVDIDVGLDLKRLHRQNAQMRTELQTFNREASRGFGTSQRAVGRLDAATRRVSKTFIGLASSVKLLTVAMAGLALYGGTRAFASFEASMNTVQAVTDANISQFSLLQQKAQELGSTTKFTATQVAGAMQFMAMAGLNVNEIYSGIGSTLKLAAAGNLDLAQSADIVTNIMTAMGLTTSELDHAVDVLTNTFVTTNTDLVQLGYAFKFAAPNASIAGITFEETSAALGLMGKAGIQATMAGTAFRGMIQRLLGPTKEAQKAMNRIGLEVFDADGKIRSLTDIIRQLEPVIARGAEGVDDLVTIFGARAFAGVAALAKQGADALELQIEKVRRTGTAGKIAEIQMRGLSGAFKELMSAAEGLAISIGESGLGAAFESMTRSAASAFRTMDQWVKSTAPLHDQSIKTLKTSYADLNNQLQEVDASIKKYSEGDTSNTLFGFLGDTDATVTMLKRQREEIVAQLEPLAEFIRLQRRLAETGKSFRTAIEQVDLGDGGGGGLGLPGQFDETAAKRAAALQQLQALEAEYLRSTNQNRRLIEVTYEHELARFKELLDQKLISQQQYEEARAQLTMLAAQRMQELEQNTSQLTQQIGQSITSNLEGALRSFVENGKVDFNSLAKSILADIAVITLRILILKPLLDSIGGGNVLGSVLHEGGTVGSSGSKRAVPAAMFIGAPRLHNGGTVIKRNEVPAILEMGETVLKKGFNLDSTRQSVSNVTVNIQTPNPEAFKASRTQVAAQLTKAVSRGRRGL